VPVVGTERTRPGRTSCVRSVHGNGPLADRVVLSRGVTCDSEAVSSRYEFRVAVPLGCVQARGPSRPGLGRRWRVASPPQLGDRSVPGCRCAGAGRGPLAPAVGLTAGEARLPWLGRRVRVG
jgi:hypothetical protein